MVYINFIYGLAYYSLGLVILLESFRPVADDLKKVFRNLALSALIYSMHQWLEGAELAKLRLDFHSNWLVALDMSMIVVSTIYLLRFGMGLLTDNRWSINLPAVLFLLVWSAFLLLGAESFPDPEGFHLFADDLARYLLVLPANIIVSLGLMRGATLDKLETSLIAGDRTILAVLFAVNALFSGLMVAGASFFPANAINSQMLMRYTGLPIELFQAVLAVGIAFFMVRMLRVFEHMFLKERTAKEVMEQDARIAADIQAGLLPAAPLAAPGIRVSARLLQSRMIGGDSFDYSIDPDGVATFLVADASGKGSSAALLCTATIMTIDIEMRSALSLVNILQNTNERLEKRFPLGSFTAVSLGRYFPRTARLELASSGQNPPLLYRHLDRRWQTVDIPGSLPLGVERFLEPTAATLNVLQGDRLLLFTDGLADLRDGAGKLVGLERVTDWLSENAHRTQDEFLDCLMSFAVDVSAGDVYDDIAVLLVDFPMGNG